MNLLGYINSVKEIRAGYLLENINIPESEFISQISSLDPILQAGEVEYKIVQDDGRNTTTSIAHSSEKFYPHIDGVHLPITPRWVVLYCTQDPKYSDMKTYLVDTTKYLYHLPQNEFDTLSILGYVFVDKDGTLFRNNLVNTNQVGEKYIHHAGRGYFVPRYSIDSEFSTKFETFDYIPVLNEMNNYFLNEKNWEQEIIFKKGDLLIFDNQRFLHGRVKLSNERDFSRKLIKIFLK